MKALRLPAHASLVPYGFGARSHARLLCSYSPKRSWRAWRKLVRPGTLDQPAFPTRHVTPVGACGISQVSWRSVLCLCPAPRPRPSRQDLALAILSMLPPRNPDRRPQRAHISLLTQGFSIRCLRLTSGGTGSHARLASGWRAAPLPGGGRTLWIASKGFRSHPILLSRTSPAARIAYAKPPFAGPEQVLGYLGRYTHRVAIANSRLVGLEHGQVSFTWKDYRQDGKTKMMTLPAREVIPPF